MPTTHLYPKPLRLPITAPTPKVRVEEELAFMDNSAIHRRLVATGSSIATGAGSLQGDGEGPGG